MRFIISTIVPGAKPNLNFLNSIKTYLKANKGTELILIPSVNLYKDDTVHQFFIDNHEKNILQNSTSLNRNIKLSTMPINPEAIDPIVGLDRHMQLEGSFIFASPKQRLKSIPNSRSLPRMIMTTGAATLPYYKNTRKGIIAAKDHVNGAIIVEVESDRVYHFRQIQAAQDGSFYDLGNKYSPSQKSFKGVYAIVPGDYHSGFTDQYAKKAIIEMSKLFKPELLVLHDFFDGISVNHHIEGNILARARMNSENDLSAELEFASNELKELSPLAKKVLIVKSNHDEFLDRWLNQGKYVFDERNHIIGLELALAKAQDKDPLEYGLNKFNKFNNIKFLNDDESLRITNKNIEIAVHGHKGSNGARGSITGLEKTYGQITYGHSHTPEILRGAFVVGTSSHLKLSYNHGASSWCHTHCLVNHDGSRQLINIVNKKWRM